MIRFEQLKEKAEAAGLECVQHSVGTATHWQIRGGDHIVNIWPVTKRGPRYSIDTGRGAPLDCSVESLIKQAGPKKPAPSGDTSFDGEVRARNMSLRDHFAGQADPREIYGADGIPTSTAEALMGEPCPTPPSGTTADWAANARWWAAALAQWKYAQADAMLAARKAGG